MDIDPIVLDEPAAAFLVPGSFPQVDIGEEAAEAFQLSDHCPTAVEPDVVGPGGPDVRARARALFEEIRAPVRKTNEKVEELNRLIPELRGEP